MKLKILSKIKKNFRYIIAAVLILAALFSGNIVGDEINISNLSQLKDKVFYSKDMIDASELSYKMPDVFDAHKGEYFRLIFDIRTESSEVDNIGPEQNNISVALASKYGDEMAIMTVSLMPSLQYTTKEAVFGTDGDYSDLIFKKESKFDTEKVIIKNVQTYRLDIHDHVSLSKLKPSVFGQTDFSHTSVANLIEGSHIFNFVGSNHEAGEIFRAETDILSSISLKMYFLGNGGIGNYELSLKKAYKDGDKISVDPEKIASIRFDTTLAEAIYSHNDLQSGYYQFPIAAKLEKGAYFYVGINNRNVSHNLLNHLRLFGTKDSRNENHVAVQLEGNRVRKIGDLNFQIFDALFVKSGEDNILTGAVIQDLGNGSGIYSYNSSDKAQDLSDLYLASGGKTKGASYNQDLEAVVIPAEPDAFLEYKINTIYPFEKLSFGFDAVGLIDTASAYYSYNNKDWTKLADMYEAAVPGDFLKTVMPAGRQSVIYLKISYDSIDNSAIANMKDPFFGLKNLRINAKLYE